jgi:hypothetical protein
MSKINNWSDAKDAAEVLYAFLAEHCPLCGKAHTETCIKNNRCKHCFNILSPCADLKQAVNALDMNASFWTGDLPTEDYDYDKFDYLDHDLDDGFVFENEF